MRKSLPALFVAWVIALALSGCIGPITNSRAQKIAVRALEDKYGGVFVVKDARSDIELQESTARVDYDLEVYSRERKLTTHVTVSGDGSRVGDDLEELMYADKVEAELKVVPCNASGWVLDGLKPTYHSYRSGQQQSASFEDYKRDSEKMELSVDVTVDGSALSPTSMKAVAASLKEYCEALQSLGYRIRLFIDCNGELERIDSLGHDDAIEQDEIEETLKNMVEEDKDASSTDTEASGSAGAGAAVSRSAAKGRM